MKKKDKLFNYTLSVGFILLIVIFLTSIILISRYVLSDDNIIQNHVENTKNLLEDIEKVEKSVEEQENTEIKKTSSISIDKKISNYEKNINQINYLNIDENRSILTFTINKELKELNNIIYIEYSNQNQINSSDVILYNVKEKGTILENKEEIKVFNFRTLETEKIEFGNILGKIIYENDEN